MKMQRNFGTLLNESSLSCRKNHNENVKKSFPAMAIGLSILFVSTLAPLAHAAEPTYNATTNWNDSENDSAASDSSYESRYRPGRRSVQTTNQRKQVSPFAPGSHNVALHVGQVFLAGELGEQYEDTLGSQLSYTYGVSDIFGFNSSLLYSDHSSSNFSVLALNTGLRANLAWFDRVVPYGIVGLGFYRTKHKIQPGENASGVVFGMNIGPGIDLIINKTFFFGASLIFHDMFSKTVATSRGQKDIGGNFTRFMVHAGITL